MNILADSSESLARSLWHSLASSVGVTLLLGLIFANYRYNPFYKEAERRYPPGIRQDLLAGVSGTGGAVGGLDNRDRDRAVRTCARLALVGLRLTSPAADWFPPHCEAMEGGWRREAA